jgi:DNA polymerase-4
MILHIDMDAFYASVEQLDNPRLKEECVIVGGLSNRSVVSAASYEARKFGIHSAMPMFQARQKCPQGIFVRPRMDRYKSVSKKIMSLLREFSPRVEVVSIDEAYVDITGCSRLYGQPHEIAAHIKNKIEDTVNLTCSVGVGPSKFIAKIASDLEKPDGLTILMPEQVPQFLEKMPVYKVPGVGKTTLKQLERMGINTLGDVSKYPEKLLLKRLGKFGRRLMELSTGMDDSPVMPVSRRKSVSSEETLLSDIDDKKVLNNYILEQAASVARQLRKEGVKAKTITLKIKHTDFKQVTRSTTLPVPTQSSETIYQTASMLLNKYRMKTKIRLIGVGASGLRADSAPAQMSLFKDSKSNNGNWEKVDKTVDSITAKYGKDVIKRGSLTKSSHELE